MRTTIKTVALGLLLGLPSLAFALGLSGVEVHSALNEPLDARIGVNATDEELSTASVILASGRDFERVGLERNSMLEFLSIRLVTDEGEPYVSVTSSDPISEPFLSFLLDVNWANGRMLREYTLLLDPPVYAPSSSVAPAPAVTALEDDEPISTSSSDTADYSSQAGTSPTTSSRTDSSDSQDSYVSYQSASEYGPVASGDTLWEIARDWRPDQSLSINQTMIALLRANPEAFIQNNINNLRRGSVLRIPDADEIRRITQAEAMESVRTQNALWQDYRQALSRAAPTTTDPASSRYSSSDTTSSTSDSARLELVPPRAGEDSGSDASALRGAGTSEMVTQLREVQDELARAQEDLATSEAYGGELQSRVDDLESVVDKLQRALNLREDELASLQAQLAMANDSDDASTGLSDLADAAAADTATDSGFDDSFAADTTASDDSMADASDADSTFGTADDMASTDGAADGADDGAADQIVDDILADLDQATGEDDSAAQDMGMDAMDSDSAMADDSSSADDDAQAGAETAVQPLPARPDRPWWHFFTTTIGMIVIGVIVLIAIIGFLMMRRGGSDEREHDTLISNLVKKRGGAPEMEADEEPLPDVMDDVALGNAIANDPDNDGLHLQLAKYYFANGQDDRFLDAAEAMHSRFGATGDAWQEVRELGAQIMPEHVLFADTGAAKEAADAIPPTQVMPELSASEFSDDEDLSLDSASEGGDELEPLEFDIESSVDSDDDDDEDEFPTLEIEDLESALSDSEDDSADDSADEFGFDFESDDSSDEEIEPATLERDAASDVSSSDDSEDDGLLFSGAGLELETASDDDAEQQDEDDFGFDLEGDAESETAESDDDELDLSALDDGESFEFDVGDRRAVNAESSDEEEEASEPEVEVDRGDVLDEAEELLSNLESDASENAARIGPDAEAGGEDATDDGSQESTGADLMDTGEHPAAEMPTSEIDLDLDDDDLFGNEDPVTTKLDLARAYVDMGDPEGARNMLEEVVDEGTDDQQGQAKRMLDDLGEDD